MAAQHWCERRPPRAVNRAAAWQGSAGGPNWKRHRPAKVANHGTGLIRHHTPLGDPVKDGWLELFNSNGLTLAEPSGGGLRCVPSFSALKTMTSPSRHRALDISLICGRPNSAQQQTRSLSAGQSSLKP